MEEASFNAAIEYGRRAVEGVFLINGGAAVAVLTFVGSASNSSPNRAAGAVPLELFERVSTSLGFFALGVLFSVACYAFSYLSQSHFTRDLDTVGYRYRRAAIGCFSVSAIAFLAGVAVAVLYFRQHGY